MKRDKISVVFIVCVAFAVTGLLQYMRSPETRKIVPYLTALESSLCVFGEGATNEFYSLNSRVQSGTKANVFPVGFFIEEQRIIEEFNNDKQIRPLLCRDEFTDYVSFYISLTNDTNIYSNTPEFKVKKLQSYDYGSIFPVAHQGDSTVNDNHHITHKIKANDSLFKLAKRYYNDGSKWEKIYQANKNEMPDPSSLKIGQELLIPNITVSNRAERERIIKT